MKQPGHYYLLLLLCFIALLTNPCQAQPPTVQDCMGAIPICRDQYHEPSPYQWSGNGNYTNEIYRYLDCYTPEDNGVWYVFTAQKTGYLRFTITPDNMGDDYDWTVFNMTNASCEDLKTFDVVNYVISTNNYGEMGEENNGITGANSAKSGGHAGHCNGPGDLNGPQWNDDISVTKGNTYMIYVSNWDGSNYGYTIDFSATDNGIYDTQPPSIREVLTNKLFCGDNILPVRFSENILCASVEIQDFRLIGPDGDYNISHISSAACDAGAKFGKDYELHVTPALKTGNYQLRLDADASGSVEDACANIAAKQRLTFKVENSHLKIDAITDAPAVCPYDNGEIDVWITDGYLPPIVYNCSGIESAPLSGTFYTFEDLPAGSHLVKAIDKSGCPSNELNINVEEVNPVEASLTTQDLKCFEDQSGKIILTANSPNGGLTYSIGNGFQSNPLFDNLSAGSYQVEVKDAGGCELTLPANLYQPSKLKYQLNATHNQCYGGESGSFKVVVSGGVPWYGVFWTGTALSAAGFKVENLKAGQYHMLIEDGNGCRIELDTAIIDPEELKLSKVEIDSISCYGQNGNVKVYPEGGTPPYRFSWESDDGFYRSTQNLIEVLPNTYLFHLHDVNSCHYYETFELKQPEMLILKEAHKDISCYHKQDGAITLSAQGGVPAYRFSLNGSPFASKTQFTNLSTGTFSIKVKDDNDCIKGKTITLTEPDSLTADIEKTDILCYGQTNGSLTAIVNGGTQAYNYRWQKTITIGTTATINNLGTGTYQLSVRDKNNCTATTSENITEPSMLLISAQISDVICHGEATGAIKLTSYGGWRPHHYLWLSGQDTISKNKTLNQVFAGQYQLQVRDKNDCLLDSLFTIQQSDSSWIDLLIDHVYCPDTLGGIKVTVNQAIAPYSYHCGDVSTPPVNWENYTFDQLKTGQYPVKVIDARGCQFIDESVLIKDTTTIRIFYDTQDITCPDGADGAFSFYTEGGKGEHVYSLDGTNYNKQTTYDNLCAGLYDLHVRDEENCIENALIKLISPAEFSLNFTVTNVACYGDSTAGISLTATGGTPPYSYQWTGEGFDCQDSMISNIPVGYYELVLTDAHNCQTQARQNIQEPTAIYIKGHCQEPACYGDSSGIIQASISGGTPDYTYFWYANKTIMGKTAQLKNAKAGQYRLLVRDKNLCEKDTVFIVSQPDSISINISSHDCICPEKHNGSIEVRSTGGAPPYHVEWSTGENGEIVEGLAPSVYHLSLTDHNGCLKKQAIEIGAENENCLTIPTAFSPNGDGINDNWELPGIENFPNAIIQIFDRHGTLLAEYCPDTRWDGTYLGKPLPIGSYFYVIDTQENIIPVKKGTVTIIR